MLEMPVDEIKSRISLYSDDSWNYEINTNCYAYALGLEMNEEEICPNAFVPGVIASNVLNISFNDIRRLPVEKRMLLDLKALELEYKVSNKKMKEDCYSSNGFWYRSWDILLFLGNRDFHFSRINCFGEMYHKQGWFLRPKKTSLPEIEKLGYTFTKRYRLSLKEKERSLFDYKRL